MWFVGSSSRRTSLSFAFARARAVRTFDFSPPERESNRWSRSSAPTPRSFRIGSFVTSLRLRAVPRAAWRVSYRAIRAVASVESHASGRAIQASTSASSASIRWASGLWAERTSRTTVSGGTFGTCGRYPYRRPSFIARSRGTSCVSPATRRKSVLFPAPFGPTRATFSPAWIVKSACSRTIVDPHAFRRSRPAMIGSMSQDSFLRSEIRLRFPRSLIAGGEPVVGENPRFRRCSLRDGGRHRGHDVPALEGANNRVSAGAPCPVIRRDVRAQDRIEAVLVRLQLRPTEGGHVLGE